jgi:hypothetical protein
MRSRCAGRAQKQKKKGAGREPMRDVNSDRPSPYVMKIPLADFHAIASIILYCLTEPVVYRGRGSRRLDVDCSTGRRPMERADEPPPPILLYRVGFGCILKVVAWEWVGGEEKKGPR